jgi:hypothetical protein
VREADLIHDFVQLRFHGGLVLTLNNAVELDGQLLANSPAGRIALASIVGRAVNDVARAADQIVVNFRGGSTLTMSLQPSQRRSPEAIRLSRPSDRTAVLSRRETQSTLRQMSVLSARRAAAALSCSAS